MVMGTFSELMELFASREDMSPEERRRAEIRSRVPVADRLHDRTEYALFCVEDMLDMIQEPGAAHLRWMEPRVRQLHDLTEQLMKVLVQ